MKRGGGGGNGQLYVFRATVSTSVASCTKVLLYPPETQYGKQRRLVIASDVPRPLGPTPSNEKEGGLFRVF